MKRTKKTIALLLAMVLSLSLFSGCGGGETTDTSAEKTVTTADAPVEVEVKDAVEDKPEEPITVTMFYPDNANYPAKDDWLVLTALKEKLNVNLELEIVPESDFKARRTILFNSGEMPDIISKTFNSDISTYTSAGLFLPISDYMDKMPNFSAFVDEYDYMPDLDNAREADGKFYMLPVNANTQRINFHGWMARVDLLEAYGLESPETMEDVYEACKVFKENNPDAYPMTNRFGSANILSKVAPAFGTIAGWGIGNMFKYDAEAVRYNFAPTSEGYKEMLIWMNKMYSEGLLDVEFSTLDSTVYEERAKSGEQFIMVDWIGNEVRYNKDGAELSGDANYSMQPIMPPKGPWGDYSGSAVPKYEQGWVINAKVAERDDFDQVLAVLDWFYSEEAAELTTFGIEGETFEILENGRKEYIDPVNTDYTKIYGINQNVLTVRRDADHFKSNRSQEVVDLFAEMNEAGVFYPQQPSLRLSDDQKEEAALYGAGLGDYINQMTEEFIFGITSIDEWDNFVAECEAKGVPQLDKLYNDAWAQQ